MPEKCEVCGAAAVKKCSGCKEVFYCGREHQKKDWARHMAVCRCYKVEENEVLGRHCVASRSIAVGEVVLKDDRPLVCGPMHNSVPVCLGCNAVLDEATAVPCAKCGWPLCRDCEGHGAECEFTTSRRDSKVSITQFGRPHPSYQCISVIRGLSLKQTDPRAYQKLLTLEDHGEAMRKEEEFVFLEPSNVVAFVKRFFKVDDITEDEIRKVFGVLQVNGHEVPITDVPYMAVYDQASFLEHNCRANCSKSFTEHGGLVVHAAVPISKGDHISICYTDALWGVTNRRHHLSRTKFFDCTCERCSDPTEFNTMFNALRCTKRGCPGSMLPKSFLEGPVDYECNRCDTRVDWSKVDEMMEEIGVELSRMRKNDVEACQDFLTKYKDVLHKNHFYNVDVSIALAQLIGQQSGGLSTVDDDLLRKKLKLCKELDELLKILVPGENRIRGLILFEMHAALAEFSRRYRDEGVRGLLLESRAHLAEARELLKRESKVLPEGKIAKRAEKNLNEIDVILQRLTTSAP